MRLRAERRTGELLKDLARATPQTANQQGANQHLVVSNDAKRPPASPYAEALRQTGISRQTAYRYEALANVPQDTFEQALRTPDKPTTTGILDRAKPQAVVQARLLRLVATWWLHGGYMATATP